MSALFIPNRKGQRLAVLVGEVPAQKGLVFIAHGLTGFKEQPHNQLFAEVFQGKGYAAVRFDTTNTLGESDGDAADATVTNYYEDLEDVIQWAATQSWYREPFVLIGHSLGGMTAALYAEQFPKKVLALAPLSTVISGKLSMEVWGESYLKEWKERGYAIRESKAKSGAITKLKWSHLEDRLRYDLLEHVDQLTMPVLLVVGENDTSSPPELQKLLYEALPGPKEIHILPGCNHHFRKPEHLEELREILAKWIDSFAKSSGR